MMKTFIQDNGGTIAWEQMNRNYFTFYKPVRLVEFYNETGYYRLSIKGKTVTISSISIEVPSDFDVALRHHGDGEIKRKEMDGDQKKRDILKKKKRRKKKK